jgi:hypothetical protein
MPGSHEGQRVRRVQPAARRPRPERRAGNMVILVIVVVALIAAAFIFAAPALDHVDQQWVTCEVDSAKPVLAGAKTATWAVEVSSSCGQIWFDKGVDSSNAAKIARKFTPHEKYEFEFGWLSRVYRQFDISTPNAQAWR